MYWYPSANDYSHSKITQKNMKKNQILLFLLLMIWTPLLGASFNESHIPIQEQGRIKPLDSFARNQLLALYGKTKLPNMSAIDWLFSVLTHDPKSLDLPIFKVENPDVINTLNLDKKEKSVYSFNDIKKVFEENKKLIPDIIKLKEDERALIDQQILALFTKKEIFIDLLKSSGCLIPIIKVTDERIAKAINIDLNESFSLSYYIRNKNKIHKRIK